MDRFWSNWAEIWAKEGSKSNEKSPRGLLLVPATPGSLLRNAFGISESHARIKRLKQVLYLVDKLQHLPTLVSKALQLKSERLCVLAPEAQGKGSVG